MLVLIVEDNTLLAYMMEDVLTEHGHVVLGPASKPAAAMRLVEQTQPALALIDIDLEDDLNGRGSCAPAGAFRRFSPPGRSPPRRRISTSRSA